MEIQTILPKWYNNKRHSPLVIRVATPFKCKKIPMNIFKYSIIQKRQ